MVLNSVSQQQAVALFRSLGDPNRLRILGVLAESAATPDELAARLDLEPRLVAPRLAHLRQLGLLKEAASPPEGRLTLDLDTLRRLGRDAFAPEQVATFGSGEAVEEWERDVLRNFFVGERLKEIPASPKKRYTVLKWLVGRFDVGTRYPECEVNALLQRYHPDFAALRRYLVDEGLLRRESGIYWREESSVLEARF
jgi:hypothetical protein